MTEPRDFWSRRKAKVQAEQASQDAMAQAAEKAVVEEDKTDAELLAEYDLPDPDTMELGDDFSAFMQKAVPDRLRRRALRKLWLSNPALANIDGLVDYGEDFTDSAMVIENLQTAYQVGKGMTKHVLEMLEAQEKADADTADETEPTEPPAEEPLIAEQEEPETVIDAPAPHVNPLDELEPEQVIETSLKPRRMTFAYVD